MKNSTLRRAMMVGVLAASGGAAFGYGDDGHEIVGAIADSRLTPATVQRLHDLVRVDCGLRELAHWPDSIRDWTSPEDQDAHVFTSHHPDEAEVSPDSDIYKQMAEYWNANRPAGPNYGPTDHRAYHFTDVPVTKKTGAYTYAPGTPGTNDHDIVHRTNLCIHILQGKPNDEERAEAADRKITKGVAVILLAHFMGDLHQPLHVGAEYFDKAKHNADPAGGRTVEEAGAEAATVFGDTGGNSIHAKIGGVSYVLHKYWDDETILRVVAQFDPTAVAKARADHSALPGTTIINCAHHLAGPVPADWQAVNLGNERLVEGWADEILPLAQKAHTRLEYVDVHYLPDGRISVQATEKADDGGGQGYNDWARGVVQKELVLAGCRLADILNQTLGAP